jgi:hypothetical protein
MGLDMGVEKRKAVFSDGHVVSPGRPSQASFVNAETNVKK